MPGSDLVAGNVTSTSLTVTGSVTLSTSVAVGSTAAIVGTGAALAILGIYRVTLSSMSGTAWLGGGNLGSTSFGIARIPSTSFTFSTNDVILGITPPTSATSTGAELGSGSLIINYAWPTSSGGIAFLLTNPSTSVSLPSPQISNVSTGAFVVTVLRTT